MFALEPREKVPAHIFHIMKVVNSNDMIKVQVDFIWPS